MQFSVLPPERCGYLCGISLFVCFAAYALWQHMRRAFGGESDTPSRAPPAVGWGCLGQRRSAADSSGGCLLTNPVVMVQQAGAQRLLRPSFPQPSVSHSVIVCKSMMWLRSQ
jgi:hypothetical protein